MDQDRVSNLALLNMESETLTDMDFNDLMNDFAEAKRENVSQL